MSESNGNDRKVKRPDIGSKPRMIAFKVTQADFDAIHDEAERLGLTMTDLLVQSALKRMPEHVSSSDLRMDGFEERLANLEALIYGQ